MDRKLIKTFILHLAMAVGYFIFAKLGLELATLNHTVSPVWPATGFAIAAIYLFGSQIWISIALGAFAANLMTDGSFFTTLLISGGNTLEAVVGAFLIRWIQGYRKHLTYHTEPLALSLSPLIASLVSSTVGVSALYLAQVITMKTIGGVWLTWWIGDSLGGLVVTPIMIYLRTDSFRTKNWKHIFGIFALMGAVSYVIFDMPNGSALIFALLPVILYVATTLNRLHVLTVSFVICLISIYATVKGTGPFSVGPLNDRLVQLQLFLASVAFTGLTLSGWGKEKLSRIPAVVLLVCWFLAGSIFYSFENGERNQNNKHFLDLTEKAQEKIQHLMHTYEEAIRGGIGLYAASDSVEMLEWRAYYNMLNVPINYPGISGIGVIWPVMKKQIPKFEADMRKQGQANFHIRPVPGQVLELETGDEPHYLIKYIEPASINSLAIGLDMGAEKNRRAAANLARDTGKPSITPKIMLSQADLKNAGFLLMLPMYKKGYSLNTIDQRRKAIQGWIYGPVISEPFFSQVLKQTTNEIEFEVFDGESVEEKNILYSNISSPATQKSRYDYTSTIQLGQRNLFIGFKKSVNFTVTNSGLIAWIGFIGSLASLLLANFMVGLQASGQRTRELADELTKELSESRQKFKEGERRLLFALDGSNDGIWDWNILKSELYVSDQICRTYGWPQISPVKTLDDLKKYPHPDDLPMIADRLAKYFSGEIAQYEVETRYQKLNGEWSWVLTRGKISERSPTGKPLRMTGMHIDIDVQKKTQLLLESAQNQLGKIANSVPSHISQWGLDLNCEFANDSFAGWFGLKGKEIVGRPIDKLFGKDVYEARKHILDKVLKGEHYHYEVDSVRPHDNADRSVIVTFLPNILKGVVEGFFLFIQDITDLKKAEKTAVKERQVALQATNIKSQFLANMSHEIRTPINGIIGMTNLLKATPLNEQQLHFADLVSRSSEALLNIINDVLDFSKVEAGKLDLEIINFHLHEMVTDVIQSISFSAETKNISLNLEFDVDTKAYYKGDPGRFRQILLNLIGNAIKFTASGNVKVRIFSDGQTDLAQDLNFEVTDTGVGISDDALTRMFQPFSQADASTSRRFGGTGLGLSICKQLVELMGGQIGVRSQLGQGSTFWFKVNLAKGQIPIKQLKVAEKLKASFPARILVAEDNRVNQQVALETLRSMGYEPHAVASGIEVLQSLKESQFDLILMDCHMPEMDGYEATQEIRLDSNLKIKSIPIVAMTANAIEGEREHCLAAGMNDYVTKPIRQAELFSAVEKWIVQCEVKPLDPVVPMEKPVVLAPVVESKVVKAHILIVEDNVINQKVMTLTLEKLGYSSDVANNGVEALKLLEKVKYDIILMDCQMPEMDGFETTLNIRKWPEQKIANLPIIAVTANAFADDKERCLNVGMDDFMVKPINAQNLSRMLDKWKDKQKSKTVIDASVMENLKSLEKPGSTELVDGLISLFIETSEESLANMKVYIADNDFNKLAEEAHSLKSGAANIGALAFSDLCAEIEKIGNRLMSSTHLEKTFKDLEAEHVVVVQALAGLKMAV